MTSTTRALTSRSKVNARNQVGEREGDERDKYDGPPHRLGRDAEDLENGVVEVGLQCTDVSHQHDRKSENPLGDEQAVGGLSGRGIHEQDFIVLEAGTRNPAPGHHDEVRARREQDQSRQPIVKPLRRIDRASLHCDRRANRDA